MAKTIDEIKKDLDDYCRENQISIWYCSDENYDDQLAIFPAGYFGEENIEKLIDKRQ